MILAVDCGSHKVGFCTMNAHDPEPVPLQVVQLALKGKELGERLCYLYDQMTLLFKDLLDQHGQDNHFLFGALEDAVLRRSPNNILPLLESRGVVRTWFWRHLGADPACIAVTECRSSLGISGGAKKPEAQARVKVLYPELSSQGEDALDAVAVAIAMYRRIRRQIVD